MFEGCKKNQKLENENDIPYSTKIENAYIVCRLGNGFFSNYFKKHASKEKRYSHIGIVSKENNGLYVYHAEASELTGVGFVKREELASFLKDAKTYDFFEFNYSDTVKNKIIEEVKTYYIKKTPFDMNFDSFNNDAVYCTELIAVAINKALENDLISPSLISFGKTLYGLDDIYANENLQKVNFNDKQNELNK